MPRDATLASVENAIIGTPRPRASWPAGDTECANSGPRMISAPSSIACWAAACAPCTLPPSSFTRSWMLGALNSARAISAAFFMDCAASAALPLADSGRMRPTLTCPVPIALPCCGGASAWRALKPRSFMLTEHAAASADAKATNIARPARHQRTGCRRNIPSLLKAEPPRGWASAKLASPTRRLNRASTPGILWTNGQSSQNDEAGFNSTRLSAPAAGGMKRDKREVRPALDGDEPRSDAAARRFLLAGQSIRAPALAPGLYVVATPIGHLGDITLRALEILAAADVIACEDTRVTRKLVDRYGIATPLTPYHDHNAAAVRPKLIARIAAGQAVALVSDAGTPLISDPGYRLVGAARDADHAVTAIPGASAVLAALASAGLPTDRFFFEGFLPPKQGARRSRIADLADIPATLVLFETGPRLATALDDLAAGLGPRAAAICRELTKLHEEVARADLPTLARAYAAQDPPRGEIVIVVAPPGEQQQDAGEVDTLLRAALGRASVKDAVAEVAEATRLPRRDVYQRALALRDEDAPDEP